MNNPFEVVAWIHIENKRLLQTKKINQAGFYMPGGKIERSESAQDALIREINEELSVNIIKDTIKRYGEFAAQAYLKPEGTKVKLTCFMADFSGVIKPSSEIEAIEYFTSEEYFNLPEKVPAGYLIFSDLKEKGLII